MPLLDQKPEVEIFWRETAQRIFLLPVSGLEAAYYIYCAGVVICLEQGADLYMVQLMPLPLIYSRGDDKCSRVFGCAVR